MEAKSMNAQHAPARRGLVTAMAVALGSCLCLTPGAEVRASTLSVSNCDDSGTGSLREAVSNAGSGDTVDLTTLGCSTISLTSGAIAVTQQALTLEGPGADLIIDGGYNDRVLDHTGSGTLLVSGLTLTSGKYVSDTAPQGGCIYSAGNVSLSDVTITRCHVVGQELSPAAGGAIYTHGNLVVIASRVTGNTAQGAAEVNSSSNGGGAVVVGDVTIKYSTFSDNQALPTVGRNSGSGALNTFGSATIVASTFSNNYAKFFGAVSFEGPPGTTALILNSTLSNNAADWNSAIYTQVPLQVFNSTVAFNQSHVQGAVYSQVSSMEFQSTIIAGNEGSGAVADDVRGTGNTPTIIGAGNLITSSNIPLPPDTITACPRLAQLSDNGGPTRTHALLDDSPAIDVGNNVNGVADDQRGAARTFGDATDIGAVEWNGHVESSFHNGFEPTCDN